MARRIQPTGVAQRWLFGAGSHGVIVPQLAAAFKRHRRVRVRPKPGGDYGPSAAADLERHLAAHPDIADVELAGPGGLFDEGIATAELIAARNLATTVKAECSA